MFCGRHVVVECSCGFRSNEVPVGLDVRSGDGCLRDIIVVAYFDQQRLVSVNYPIPVPADVASTVENISKVLKANYGNCLLRDFENLDATCPECGRSRLRIEETGEQSG